MSEDYYYEPYKNAIICHYKKTRGYQTFPYHRHNGFEIYLFLAGNIRVYVGTNCYQPLPGDFILIPPSCMHRIVSMDDAEYERITINIKQSVFDELSTARTDLSKCFSSSNTMPIHLITSEKEEFITYAKKLEKSLESTEYGADILSNINLSKILLLANQRVQLSISNNYNNIMPDLIKDIMEHIHAHLQEELSLTVLSKKFFRSGTYISRQFKIHTGLTLRDYILDCRVEHAKRLLVRGYSVSDACYTSGFHDYANFIRSFSKIVGVPPGKFAHHKHES